MDSKKVKLESGKEITIKPATWKQIHETHLLSILSKYNGKDVSVIDEDDMDIVLSIALSEEVRNLLSLKDALSVFSTVVETSLGGDESTK